MNEQLTTKESYDDQDLVYVDPEKRIVLGLVQWNQNGKPKPLSMPAVEGDANEKHRHRARCYPWGTYRSMKHVWKLEGKISDTRPMLPLDEAIAKAQKEPFWD
jgi:hypothetical protein